MADVWQIVVTIGGVKIKLLIKSQTADASLPTSSCRMSFGVFCNISALCGLMGESEE